MPKATGEEVADPERPGLAQSRVQGVLSTRALLSREGRETGPQLWHLSPRPSQLTEGLCGLHCPRVTPAGPQP